MLEVVGTVLEVIVMCIFVFMGLALGFVLGERHGRGDDGKGEEK